MLVSHTHRFIFVKTHKTAGSSLEEYLKPFCKENGIIDTVKFNSHRPASSIREMVGDEIWQSYTKICPVRNPWDKMVSLYSWRRRKRSVFYHLYRMLKGKHPRPIEQRLDFESLIKSWGMICNLDKRIMFINDEWEDYSFIRYETLQEDLEALCKQLNIPFEPDKLPQKKVGFRKDKEYRTHYTDETRKIITEAFKEEIEKFSYEF